MAVDWTEPIEERALVRVERAGGLEPIHGVPLAAGGELVLVLCVRDFLWDGFRLLPAASVARLRRGALEKFREAVLRAEGRFADWEALTADADVPTGDWRSAARALRARPLVQIESEEDGGDLLHVGRVLRANKRSLALRGYDPFGRPGAEQRIPYDGITALGFGQPYLETLARYLREG